MATTLLDEAHSRYAGAGPSLETGVCSPAPCRTASSPHKPSHPLRAAFRGGLPMTLALSRTCAISAWLLLALCLGASPTLAQAPAALKGTAYITSWFGGVVTAIDLASSSTEKRSPSESTTTTWRCGPTKSRPGSRTTTREPSRSLTQGRTASPRLSKPERASTHLFQP